MFQYACVNTLRNCAICQRTRDNTHPAMQCVNAYTRQYICGYAVRRCARVNTPAASVQQYIKKVDTHPYSLVHSVIMRFSRSAGALRFWLHPGEKEKCRRLQLLLLRRRWDLRRTDGWTDGKEAGTSIKACRCPNWIGRRLLMYRVDGWSVEWNNNGRHSTSASSSFSALPAAAASPGISFFFFFFFCRCCNNKR